MAADAGQVGPWGLMFAADGCVQCAASWKWKLASPLAPPLGRPDENERVPKSKLSEMTESFLLADEDGRQWAARIAAARIPTCRPSTPSHRGLSLFRLLLISLAATNPQLSVVNTFPAVACYFFAAVDGAECAPPPESSSPMSIGTSS